MPVGAARCQGTAGQTALAILTFGALALGIFAIALLRSGWRDWRAIDPGNLPVGAGYVVVGGVTIAIAPFVIPCAYQLRHPSALTKEAAEPRD